MTGTLGCLFIVGTPSDALTGSDPVATVASMGDVIAPDPLAATPVP